MSVRKNTSKTTVKTQSSKLSASQHLKAAGPNGIQRNLNARPDGLDFRDKMYIPTLIEVPTVRRLEDYQKLQIPVLDQGTEGACTGFGLATVVHYLLHTRQFVPEKNRISPFMLYDMARRYDEWAGVDYDGSSCRGAVKGWHKHGVCLDSSWKRKGKKIGTLTEEITRDAAARPLGAYFRVNHKDLVAMHAAITEVGILYASASVHSGWMNVKADGKIHFNDKLLGGHAFAIVAYDNTGFWVQNSWGPSWGRNGFCHISYDDWLVNGTDVWVARLAVPVALSNAVAAKNTMQNSSLSKKGFAFSDIRPHIISIKNDGLLDEHGNIGTTPDMVREILLNDFPRITKDWKKKRIVLYAHGGLVSQDNALQRIAEYRETMLAEECYPLAFIWKTDYWTTLKNMLSDAARRRRPEGVIDSSKDFMLDRLDDLLEPLARTLTGKAEWSEMKENALLATRSPHGGARIVADYLKELLDLDKDVEIHLVGHSAGSIFHAPLIEYLTGSSLPNARPKGLGLSIATCTLWAPACTIELFKSSYLPAINSQKIQKFNLFTLTDKAEQEDNCAKIYNKSLLYMVSNAFEERVRIPLIRPDGEPILGMEKFVAKDALLKNLFNTTNSQWIVAPNHHPLGSPLASSASHHGDFDDDDATVSATLAHITGKKTAQAQWNFRYSASTKRTLRNRIEQI